MSQHQRAFSKRNVLKEPSKYAMVRKKQYYPRPQKSLVYSNYKRGPEKKNIDTFFAVTSPVNSAWSVPTQLNVSPTGTNQNQRIGRSILMTSIQLRYNLLRSGSNGPSQARIVVVYDRQSNFSIPLATEVFNTDVNISPLNLTNSDRFVVLFDELTDSMQSSSLNISGYRYRKIGLEAIYNGNQGASSQVATGGVWLWISNNGGTTIGTTLDCDIFTRVRFTDK